MFHRPDMAFSHLRVDDQPAYLQATYKMHYSVYCREKRFLTANDYPDRLETDEYDRCSLHFSAINDEELIKGTSRLSPSSPTPIDEQTNPPSDLSASIPNWCSS